VVLQDLLIDINNLTIIDNQRVPIRVLASAVDKHLAELSNEPHSKLDEANLVQVFFHRKVNFDDSVVVELWGSSDDCDNLRDVFFPHVAVGQSEHFDHCIDVPFLVRSIFLANLANLV